LKTTPEANGDTKVCSFLSNQKVIEIEASYVRTKLRSVVELIGEVVLDFGKEDIGLYFMGNDNVFIRSFRCNHPTSRKMVLSCIS
jgi:hypothetical protein